MNYMSIVPTDLMPTVVNFSINTGSTDECLSTYFKLSMVCKEWNGWCSALLRNPL